MLPEYIPVIATLGDVTADRIVPARPLLDFFDRMFPMLAHSSEADFLKGRWHRWKGGHDLLLDVLPRMRHDPAGALHHAGHVLLTDFATKDGIPIPGFSRNGLGGYLTEKFSFSGQWLCLNTTNAVFGLLAAGEGADDIAQAIEGTMKPCWATFWDTFGEGAMEACGAYVTKNPLMAAAAFENITAGCIAYGRDLIKELSFIAGRLDSDALLQAGFCSLLLGSSLSALINLGLSQKADPVSVAVTGGRAALIGALGTVSTCFSIGATLGFALFHLGRKYAQAQHKRYMSAQDISPEVLAIIINDNMQDPVFRSVWNAGFISMDTLPFLELPEIPLPHADIPDPLEHIRGFLNLPTISMPEIPLPHVDMPDPLEHMRGFPNLPTLSMPEAHFNMPGANIFP